VAAARRLICLRDSGRGDFVRIVQHRLVQPGMRAHHTAIYRDQPTEHQVAEQSLQPGFVAVLNLLGFVENRVRADHPSRVIRNLAITALMAILVQFKPRPS
jgi:hypothetical protein